MAKKFITGVYDDADAAIWIRKEGTYWVVYTAPFAPDETEEYRVSFKSKRRAIEYLKSQEIFWKKDNVQTKSNH